MTTIIFFGAIGFLVITIAIFFASKRFRAAIDFMIPICGIYLFLCLMPVLIEDPRKTKFI
jgi:hypothetical protein